MIPACNGIAAGDRNESVVQARVPPAQTLKERPQAEELGSGSSGQ